MKKQLIFFALFFSLFSITNAQNSNRFGLRVGAAIGNYNVPAGVVGFTADKDLHLLGRLTYQIPFNAFTSIQLEAGLALRSLKWRLDDEFSFEPDPLLTFAMVEAGVTVRQNLNLGDPVQFYLLTGAALSHTFAASGKLAETRYTINLQETGFERLDLVMEVGGGINFGWRQQYGLEVRYGQGISGLMLERGGPTTVNQQLSLAMNYRF